MRVSNRKLTPLQVAAIAASTEHGKVLAHRYGVSMTCICRVRRGYTYKWISA